MMLDPVSLWLISFGTVPALCGCAAAPDVLLGAMDAGQEIVVRTVKECKGQPFKLR